MHLTETIGAAQFIFFAAVVTAAFAVRGATGFGSAAIAVPLGALMLPVQLVIPVVAGLQLLSMAAFGARNWRAVAWPEMLRIVPFLVAGVLIGLYLFVQLDSRILARGLGIFVIAYAIFSMATAGKSDGEPRRVPWPVAVALNTVGGLIGALFGGASAPFYAIYLNALHLARDTFRATMTMVILTQVVLRIGGYAGMGLFDDAALLISVTALPFMMLGAKLGDAIAARVEQRTFNRIVGAVLLVSGTALVLR